MKNHQNYRIEEKVGDLINHFQDPPKFASLVIGNVSVIRKFTIRSYFLVAGFV